MLSTYFHKPRNGPLRFGPHWDFDRALGSTDGRDANPRIWSTGPFFSAAWWSRLFQDKDFWQRWVDRWQARRADHFSQANLDRLIDELANEIRPAYPRELAKWRVRPRRANGQAGGTFDTEMQWMKNWLSNWMDFIDRQLTQPPAFSTPGGHVVPGIAVSLSAPPGAALYYTLEAQRSTRPAGRHRPDGPPVHGAARHFQQRPDHGAGPRPAQKQVGGPPSASSTIWSAPVAATFLVDPPQVLLTEIMFIGGPGAGRVAARGGTGVSRTAQHRFPARGLGGLPPHERRRVSLPGRERDHAAGSRRTGRGGAGPGRVSRAAYPAVTRLAGPFTGSLGNGGNRLLV